MKPVLETNTGKLYQGECLEWLLTLPDESVDAVITDPPYSSGGQFRSDRVQAPVEKYVQTGTIISRSDFSGDNRDQRGFLIWSTLWLSQCYRVVKNGGIVCLFTDWRQLPVTTDILQAAGFVWRGIGVWDKTEAARPSKGRFRNQCEFVAWGTRGLAPKEGECLPGVWRKAVNAKYKYHVTGKPTEIMEEVSKIVPAGGVVIDPFMGSGTTAIACERLGLKWLGIELNPEYCEIAKERILHNGYRVVKTENQLELLQSLN